MKTQSRDTHPDIEHVQIELLRKATVAQRVSLAFSLSETVLDLAWQAIERANPVDTKVEITYKFVSVHYWEELATRLRAYMVQQRL